MAYSDFQSWCERYSILFIDRGPAWSEDMESPGDICVYEDVRWATDLNMNKDKGRCLVWFDGQKVRSVEGIKSLKYEEDDFRWTMKDRYGRDWRVQGWFLPYHKKLRDEYLKNRRDNHSWSVNRMKEMLEGDLDKALSMNFGGDDG